MYELLLNVLALRYCVPRVYVHISLVLMYHRQGCGRFRE